MDKGITELIEDSVVYQLKAKLVALGWEDADEWVIIGYVEPESKPPVVAVEYNRVVKKSAEMGNSKNLARYILDVTIKGKHDGDMKALMDSIRSCLHPLRIIDFNIAMPGDEEFDEDTQIWAWAQVYELSAVVRDINTNEALVSVVVTPNRAI